MAVLPTLWFSREFGLSFLWSCGFFQDLRVACFWACFLLISVLRIAFFKFCGTFVVLMHC